MRLLNVHKLTLKEFNDDNRPSYAILSHTWGDGEVSFQDIQTPDVAASMAGYAKILKCCEVAKQDGFDYVWIDTCCIDKTSSAELSEAINSMFRWYSLATVCYAFLSDVVEVEKYQGSESQFRRSRWFTRGWTLQELLAPEIVIFFNSNWVDIGTKHSLRDTISEITNIPVEALLNTANYIHNSSIAERMSWAAHRETTRVEDIAYSLMGIFDVNMPPLYGEGIKAFQRLQLEIMRYSKDESILAWNFAWSATTDSNVLGPMALSPLYFKGCRGIIQKERPQSTPPFLMTSRGLHIWLPGIRAHYPDGGIILYAECINRQDEKRIFVAFWLIKDSQEWNRVTSKIYYSEDVDAKLIRSKHLPRKETVDVPMELYVRQRSSFPGALFRMNKPRIDVKFHLTPNQSPETGYCIQHLWILKQTTWRPGHVILAYCDIQSIRDPGIRAVVALGSDARSRSTSYPSHCRIFPGSDIPSSLQTLVDYLKSNKAGNSQRSYDSAFPHEETMVYPGDKIVKPLSNDDMISITIRTGPTTFDTVERESVINLHVNIEFVSTSYKGN